MSVWTTLSQLVGGRPSGVFFLHLTGESWCKGPLDVGGRPHLLILQVSVASVVSALKALCAHGRCKMVESLCTKEIIVCGET